MGEPRFGQFAKCVVESNFEGFVGTESVGSSGDDSDLAVESLDGAATDLTLGLEFPYLCCLRQREDACRRTTKRAPQPTPESLAELPREVQDL